MDVEYNVHPYFPVWSTDMKVHEDGGQFQQ